MIITVVDHYPKIPNPPREPKLRKAIHAYDQGKITKEELEKIFDEVTQEVIEEQISAGVELITDGQIRWEDGQSYIARKLEGTQIGGLIRYFDNNTYYRQPVIVGEIKWKEPIIVEDWKKAQKWAGSIPVKAVLTGPYTLGRLSRDEYYKNLEKLVKAYTNALIEETKLLEENKVKYLQFNEPSIQYYPEDIDLLIEVYKEIRKYFSGNLAIYTYFHTVIPIKNRLKDLPVDTFGIDFVSRKENFEIIQEFPKNLALGYGIVDARNTKLETPEQIASLIKKALECIPEDKLFVNPSCGLEYLPRERAYDKLVNLVKGVNLVRGERK
ncbi:methylcobamide--CoM methyltransferase [Dictyoglomus thermophilum]|uniref:5-methyltetrahydropteroyltriglutamate--homocysteine S-methyltransferase n=1 Tax=Dictyoglomus thermophilum (strain ATCC 35947 / DSM 3960 / H-6-12) TaxID=309799 RepID=B5YAI9_DICT6|nr:methylcobamide--CoM methyltransferase [Dictyoglomus thermophilum]ACI18672.1 probable methylcobalamin:homocysteine methyltransferase, putative [Dictyoglomus thermophilum H-6-12]